MNHACSDCISRLHGQSEALRDVLGTRATCRHRSLSPHNTSHKKPRTSASPGPSSPATSHAREGNIPPGSFSVTPPATTGPSSPSESSTQRHAESGSSAGETHGCHPTVFDVHCDAQKIAGLPAWAPFSSAEEWEFAEWVIESGISQRDTDKLLKTGMVSNTSMSVCELRMLTHKLVLLLSHHCPRPLCLV